MQPGDVHGTKFV